MLQFLLLQLWQKGCLPLGSMFPLPTAQAGKFILEPLQLPSPLQLGPGNLEREL